MVTDASGSSNGDIVKVMACAGKVEQSSSVLHDVAADVKIVEEQVEKEKDYGLSVRVSKNLNVSLGVVAVTIEPKDMGFPDSEEWDSSTGQSMQDWMEQVARTWRTSKSPAASERLSDAELRRARAF